jgi:hypothetical protein
MSATWPLVAKSPAARACRSGIDAEGGRVKADQAPGQSTEAAAQPAKGPDRTPDLDAMIDALVKLLAHQAARQHLHRLANPDPEEITNED